MKTYEGRNIAGDKRVTVNGAPLPIEPRLTDDLLTNFSWGDESPGAQQLAYSLLADALGESHTIVWQDFLHSVVSKLDQNYWKQTDEEIREFCERVVSIQSSVPPDEWTAAGSGPVTLSTVPAQPLNNGGHS